MFCLLYVGPTIWAISFYSSLEELKLLTVLTGLVCCWWITLGIICLRVLFSSLLKVDFTEYRILGQQIFFLQHLKYFILLSSLYGFLWEIQSCVLFFVLFFLFPLKISCFLLWLLLTFLLRFWFSEIWVWYTLV